ncbi:MAG TPA: hypothetical protein VGA18_03135, partial [Rhodothermales bacterium]
MNIVVLASVIAALVVIRFLKPNALIWLGVSWIALYVAFRYGIEPPLPSSIVVMFMGIVTIAALAFMTADSERMREVRQSFVKFVVDRAYRIPLVLVL